MSCILGTQHARRDKKRNQGLRHRRQTTRPKAEACPPPCFIVLSGLAPCFYPASALSSGLTVREWLHLYSPKITFSPLKALLSWCGPSWKWVWHPWPKATSSKSPPASLIYNFLRLNLFELIHFPLLSSRVFFFSNRNICFLSFFVPFILFYCMFCLSWHWHFWKVQLSISGFKER